MSNPGDMSNDELYEAINKKYGKNWGIIDLDPNDPLVMELARRIACGLD